MSADHSRDSPPPRSGVVPIGALRHTQTSEPARRSFSNRSTRHAQPRVGSPVSELTLLTAWPIAPAHASLGIGSRRSLGLVHGSIARKSHEGSGCGSVRQLVLAILVLSAATLQVSVLPKLAPFGIVPDAVLGLVLVASALEGMPAGLFWSIVGGLALDLLAAGPWGAHTLALLPAVLAGSATRQSMYRSALVPLMGIVGIVTLGYRSVLTLVQWPASAEAWIDAAITAFLVSVVNMMVVPLVYGVVVLLARAGVRRVR